MTGDKSAGPDLVLADLPGAGSPPAVAPATLQLPFSALEHFDRAAMLLAPAVGGADPFIVYANAAFETLTGVDRRLAVGQSPRVLMGAGGQAGWLGRLGRRLRRAQSCRERCLLRCRDRVSAALLEADPLRDDDGRVAYWLVRVRDLASGDEDGGSMSKELLFQATHDSLTGLINRGEFERLLREALRSAQSERRQHVLCYIDLDQFKVVNDTCGHAAGDELLRQLGQLMPLCLGEDTVIARLGGDEFAVLLEDTTTGQAHRLAAKLLEAIADFRYACDGKLFRIGASIGLVAVTSGSVSAARLLSAADTACFAAKDLGRNRVYEHHEEDGEIVRRHGEMAWVTRIQAALDEKRFRLHCQRIEALETAASTQPHFEVLLRMQGRDGELIMPKGFLQAAETYHLSTRLDTWVVNTMLAYLADQPLQQDGQALYCINLSGHSITDSGFLDVIVNQLRQAPHVARSVCFEITETAVISNLSLASRFIRSLRDLGCRFSLDDFGSGLSSFGYLRHLPVDLIKIDGMFVRNITRDPVNLAVVRSINEIGHVMGKQTVAEFVEDEATLRQVRELGVDYAQGYHIARPAPMT